MWDMVARQASSQAAPRLLSRHAASVSHKGQAARGVRRHLRRTKACEIREAGLMATPSPSPVARIHQNSAMTERVEFPRVRTLPGWNRLGGRFRSAARERTTDERAQVPDDDEHSAVP